MSAMPTVYGVTDATQLKRAIDWAIDQKDVHYQPNDVVATIGTTNPFLTYKIGTGNYLIAFAPQSGAWVKAPAGQVATDPSLYVHHHIEFDPSDWIEANWKIDTVDGGSDGLEVIALADRDGGWLEITTNDADDDSENIQAKAEIVKLTSGKRVHVGFRVELPDDATQCGWFVGVAVKTSDVLSQGVGNTEDLIGFQKDDGDTDIDFVCQKNGAGAGSSAVGTAVASTVMRVEFIKDEDDAVTIFIDGTSVGTVSADIPDDQELAPVFHLRNGDANARTMYVDYEDIKQVRT